MQNVKARVYLIAMMILPCSEISDKDREFYYKDRKLDVWE